jgi:hypothetical protein
VVLPPQPTSMANRAMTMPPLARNAIPVEAVLLKPVTFVLKISYYLRSHLTSHWVSLGDKQLSMGFGHESYFEGRDGDVWAGECIRKGK